MKFLSNIDLAQNQILNPVAQNLASAPGSPNAGQFYFDTSTNTLYWYSGSAWVAATGTTSFGNVTAQTTFGQASGNGSASTASHSDHTHGTPTHIDSDHSGVHLSALAAPTAAVSFNGQNLTNLATPVNASDAANKSYVDGAVAGLTWKDPVQAATTADLNGAYTYSAGVITGPANTALSAIDGYAPAVNDRVLLKSLATGSRNGIYIVNALGSGSSQYQLTRSTDADAAAELQGAATYVEQGTTNGTTQWVMSTTGAITLDTTSLTWTQFSGASAATAGNGLTSSGNTFNVGAANGITVNADSIQVDTAVVVRKFAATIGDNSSTSITITHNLGTQDITVSVRDASSNTVVFTDWTATSTTQATFVFNTAPATNAYRVVVHG